MGKSKWGRGKFMGRRLIMSNGNTRETLSKLDALVNYTILICQRDRPPKWLKKLYRMRARRWRVDDECCVTEKWQQKIHKHRLVVIQMHPSELQSRHESNYERCIWTFPTWNAMKKIYGARAKVAAARQKHCHKNHFERHKTLMKIECMRSPPSIPFPRRETLFQHERLCGIHYAASSPAAFETSISKRIRTSAAERRSWRTFPVTSRKVIQRIRSRLVMSLK